MNKTVISAIGVVAAVVIAISLVANLTKDPEPPPEPDIDIWKAASEGQLDVVKQHIEYGTDINGTFDLPGVPGSGGTPLHIACLTCQTEVVNLLVKQGADLNRKAVHPDPFGGTPLHWAAAAGNATAVEVLLNAGANVNSTDNEGATPMDAVFVDLATGSILDQANLPAEKQRIYSKLSEIGGRHRG